MERKTIFPTDCALNTYDRNQIRWEDYLFTLTPIEERGGVYFKREDYFAPLGYDSVNGSKLRQCIWLVDEWVKKKQIAGIVSGSVVGSPQHPFISSICKHYDIGCLIVTGSKNYLTHKNMILAESLGAKFYVAKVGYARALQSISFKLAKRLPRHEVLETNITVDEKYNSAERIEEFHSIGAHQVKNIPQHIETLIIPAGSCNSIVSILYGLSIHKKNNIKRIIMMGIGNNGSFNMKYIPKRLSIIGNVIRKDINSDYNWGVIGGPSGEIEMIHCNLNGSGYCDYSDWYEHTFDDIIFHPRYEGKCMRYISENMDYFGQFWNSKTLFWIVGNEPKWV